MPQHLATGARFGTLEQCCQLFELSPTTSYNQATLTSFETATFLGSMFSCLACDLQGKVSLMQLSRSGMGSGILATLLNIDNTMQDRNTSEWGASRAVVLS